MNVKLLRKVKRHILEEPKRYDQDDVVSIKGRDKGKHFPACGTIACIGGWALILSGKTPEQVAELTNPLFDTARRLLGLTRRQASNLLPMAIGWPERFATDYLRASNRHERAKIAAERIEHFIRTKGKE